VPDYNDLTKDELKAELDSRGVEYHASANKDELVAALEESEQAAGPQDAQVSPQSAGDLTVTITAGVTDGEATAGTPVTITVQDSDSNELTPSDLDSIDWGDGTVDDPATTFMHTYGAAIAGIAIDVSQNSGADTGTSETFDVQAAPPVTVLFTPTQVVTSSLEIAGQPTWVAEQALQKAGLMQSEFLAQSDIDQAVSDLLSRPVVAPPMPGRGG
jgi:Putative nuclear envelope organisation protein/T4 recombination endonuclease VII, dimerisation